MLLISPATIKLVPLAAEINTSLFPKSESHIKNTSLGIFAKIAASTVSLMIVVGLSALALCKTKSKPNQGLCRRPPFAFENFSAVGAASL
jgi:hypothetical protein